jgi:hypothetical protein
MPAPNTPPLATDDASALDRDREHGLAMHAADDDTRDWTLDLPDTPHVRFFRETAWATSALGPLAQWDAALRLFTRMIFADSRAACLWWCGFHGAPQSRC